MGNEPASAQLIDKMLPMAFVMWLTDLKDRDYEYLQKRAGVCSKTIAEKGDVLMYGSKTKGNAGECFNRLAEGMACLTLISRHPVPFGKLVFHHTGEVERFDTEEAANERVWPEKVSKVRKEDHGASQSETVPAVRKRAPKTSRGKTEPEAGSNG